MTHFALAAIYCAPISGIGIVAIRSRTSFWSWSRHKPSLACAFEDVGGDAAIGAALKKRRAVAEELMAAIKEHESWFRS
jgi:hypothetical protein